MNPLIIIIIICQKLSVMQEFVGGLPRKRHVAVHDLSLAVNRGECFGLLG